MAEFSEEALTHSRRLEAGADEEDVLPPLEGPHHVVSEILPPSAPRRRPRPVRWSDPSVEGVLGTTGLAANGFEERGASGLSAPRATAYIPRLYPGSLPGGRGGDGGNDENSENRGPAAAEQTFTVTIRRTAAKGGRRKTKRRGAKKSKKSTKSRKTRKPKRFTRKHRKAYRKH